MMDVLHRGTSTTPNVAGQGEPKPVFHRLALDEDLVITDGTCNSKLTPNHLFLHWESNPYDL